MKVFVVIVVVFMVFVVVVVIATVLLLLYCYILNCKDSTNKTRKHHCTVFPILSPCCPNKETFVTEAKCFRKTSDTFYISSKQNFLPQQINAACICKQKQCILVCSGYSVQYRYHRIVYRDVWLRQHETIILGEWV